MVKSNKMIRPLDWPKRIYCDRKMYSDTDYYTTKTRDTRRTHTVLYWRHFSENNKALWCQIDAYIGTITSPYVR